MAVRPGSVGMGGARSSVRGGGGAPGQVGALSTPSADGNAPAPGHLQIETAGRGGDSARRQGRDQVEVALPEAGSTWVAAQRTIGLTTRALASPTLDLGAGGRSRVPTRPASPRHTDWRGTAADRPAARAGRRDRGRWPGLSSDTAPCAWSSVNRGARPRVSATALSAPRRSSGSMKPASQCRRETLAPGVGPKEVKRCVEARSRDTPRTPVAFVIGCGADPGQGRDRVASTVKFFLDRWTGAAGSKPEGPFSTA